jgi:hypothetical protein
MGRFGAASPELIPRVDRVILGCDGRLITDQTDRPALAVPLAAASAVHSPRGESAMQLTRIGKSAIDPEEIMGIIDEGNQIIVFWRNRELPSNFAYEGANDLREYIQTLKDALEPPDSKSPSTP